MKKWLPSILFLSVPVFLCAQLIQFSIPSEVNHTEIINRTSELNTIVNEDVLDSTVYFRYNESTSEFDRETKNTLFYNGKGLNNKGLVQQWDGSQGRWIDDEQYFNTYNSSDQLTETIHQEWMNNDWVNDLRQELQYQGDNLTMLIFSEWENNAWLDQIRFTFQYNGEGNVTIFKTEEWSENKWNNLSRTVSTYDNKGYLIKEISSMWDGGWVEFSQDLYTNNNEGLTTMVETQTAIGPDMWLPSFRTLFSYNNENQVSEETYQFYNLAMDNWDNQSRTTYSYDGNSNLTVLLYEFYQGNAWVANERTTYQYDGNNNEIESLDEIWLNNQWLKESKLISYYGSGSTSVTEIGNLNYQLVMANPIHRGGNIQFKIDDSSPFMMEIRDINGVVLNRLTFTRSFQHHIPMEISSGTYFFIIRNNKHVLISQKVIVL